jgi:hypothetical protein
MKNQKFPDVIDVVITSDDVKKSSGYVSNINCPLGVALKRMGYNPFVGGNDVAFFKKKVTNYDRNKIVSRYEMSQFKADLLQGIMSRKKDLKIRLKKES